MTIIELDIWLNSNRVKAGAVALQYGTHNECYCVQEVYGNWEVFYSERGQKTDLKIFDNENDACEYLKALVERDPTVFLDNGNEG